ncbi:histidinol dehydrogenase (plasmid) [Paroceanicella profunda]|uniref:Histidinol dehydrogenase homolog n=1 Tax=Paroceanicella profunda TaxID=2579971 RepID=A0A5B8FIJ2_9RHOB|nr:histidinol dehydrogenase [Paroceanicella profunda]QDL93871.1 histidinol dehydrogenase [Paroceanicella profunda]
MTDVSFHRLSEIDDAGRRALMGRAESDLTPFIDKVRPIIEAVRTQGDIALARYARELDRAPVEANAIAATKADFDAAFAALDPKMIELLEFACDNVRRFHEAQMPEEMWMKEMHPGVWAGDRVVPIDSVACYVPRGKGSFPSVVMMTAIPAVVAGVPNPVIITPPGPDGKVDAATLVAARIAGVEQVFKAGGAQGVAAVAYGTETVPRCLKIVGPGSPWVVAAKSLLSGRLDPGTPAGPSEAIVLADHTANGAACALDLLNEAEHGPDSASWLVTCSEEVAETARAALPGYWARMGAQRVEFSQKVLCGPRGGILLTQTMEEAISWVNDYAPEHLVVHSDDPYGYLGQLRNAGEILLGENTPIALGNFVLGPNAVLPTNFAARTHSPLGVHDYLKRISVGHVTPKGYATLAPWAKRFAEYEGFDAHANAVSELRETALGRE